MSAVTDLPLRRPLVGRVLAWRARAAAGDRGAHRWQRIFVSAFTSVAARGVAMVCTLLTIPLAIHYLGAERYGTWMVLTSSASMLAIFDFGLGVGLQNRAAAMLGRDDLAALGLCLRSTFVVLAVIAALLLGGIVLLLTATSLASGLFPPTALAGAEANVLLAIVAGAFCLGLPLGLFSRLALGLQHGWIASVAATCGTACSLLAVLIATQLQASFTTFVAITVVPPFAAHAMSIALLAPRIPGGLRLLGPVRLGEGLRTLRLGSRYVLPQIAAAVVIQSPVVLLGTLAGPVHAATYSVLTRIALPLQQLQQMFLDQVWPAITEALHRGDSAWLHRTLRRLVRSSLAFAVVATAGVALGIHFLFPLLTRSAGLEPSLAVVLLFAANLGAMCFVQTLAYISNGLARLKQQTLFAAISVVYVFTALPFSVTRFELVGLLIALLALHALFALPLLWTEYARFLAGDDAAQPQEARP